MTSSSDTAILSVLNPLLLEKDVGGGESLNVKSGFFVALFSVVVYWGRQ
jgi:hypothetical protein